MQLYENATPELIAHFKRWKESFYPANSVTPIEENRAEAKKLWKSLESYIGGKLITFSYVDAGYFKFPDGSECQLTSWILFAHIQETRMANSYLRAPE